MSKQFQSTLLLFIIGIGFGIFSIWSLVNAHTRDDTLQGILYLIPALAAFGALLLLPFKKS